MSLATFRTVLVANLFPSQVFPARGVFVRNFRDRLAELGIVFDRQIFLRLHSKGLVHKALVYGLFLSRVAASLVFGSRTLWYVHYPLQVSVVFRVLQAFGRLRGDHFIFNWHGSDLIPETGRSRRLLSIQRAFLARASLHVASSDYFRREIVTRLGVLPERVLVYPAGGIDPTVFWSREQSPTVRKFGFVSRLVSDKGCWELFRSWQILRAELPETRLVIVGDGPEFGTLKALAAEYPEVEVLRGLGQGQLAELLRTIDVFVFPTKRQSESLGLVGIEAMASGCLVIGSRIGGVATYLRDRQNGILVTPGSVEELCSAIREVIAMTSETRTRLTRAALETAKQFESVTVTKAFVDDLARRVGEF